MSEAKPWGVGTLPAVPVERAKRAMGSMHVVALVLALAACGSDPRLHVHVDHPADLDVQTTVVSVYESENLGCIDVAFARVGADELAAVLVAEQTIGSDGDVTGGLDGISRTDKKVVVVRGYDAAGGWIAAGCAEQGVVDGSAVLDISTMATVTASTFVDPNDADPYQAVVVATDKDSNPVANRRVGWTVYGPAGSKPMYASRANAVVDGVWEPTGASCTNINGAVRVHPIPPDVLGGYATQLRLEWATELPPLYTGIGAAFDQKPAAAPNNSRRYCAIRINGSTRRLVCFETANLIREYDVIVTGDTVTLDPKGFLAEVDPDNLALVSVPSGADRDVYLMKSTGELIGLFGAPAPDNSTPPCPGGTACRVLDVLSVPACDPTPGRLLALVEIAATGAQQLVQLDARGGNLASFPSGTLAAMSQIQLDSAGCVTRIDPTGIGLRQVVTYHVGARNLAGEFGAFATRAVYNCTQTRCMGNELLPGAGVAFTGGAEPRMIVTSLDATGVVLVHVLLAPDDSDRDTLVQRERYPSASVPDHLVVGQFDGDSASDLFWDIAARRGTTFEIAYAREVGDQPLEALSPAQTLSVDALSAADLTGDGRDDLVIAGRVGAVTGVAVIPMHVTLPLAAIVPDSTCSP